MQNWGSEKQHIIETQLSIEKALQFAGNNSSYQKKRLLILSIIILSVAILTCKIPLEGPKMTMLFLIFSGAGQIVCPIALSLRTCTLGLSGFAIFGFAFYPFSTFLTQFAYCGLGFFGRGFYVSSLIYLNEIGGDKFRAWSMLVVFGVWGISSLFSSLERLLKFPPWLWVYLFVFISIIVDSSFVLNYWKPSPFHLYTKRLFKEAKQVLNEMAQQNGRAHLPYGLEGEQDQQCLQYKKPTYSDIIYRPIIRKITIPLFVLWIYREYIYFGSYVMIPQLGQEVTQNYFLISISEIAGVLLSYPIRLNLKRVNTFFIVTILISICSVCSSFTTLQNSQCWLLGHSCATKYIYRISIMMIRFSIVLMGNILISYTLEIYPSNARSLGFSLCLGISSVGSILMPWINSTFIYVDLSGFISLALASFVAMYFISKLNETYGRMRTQNLEQLEQSAPQISLKNWANLNF